MTTISASISRTAKDALQAKHSALQAGFMPAPCNTEEYSSLLKTLATAVEATRRQTPLINAGYAMRMASMLHQVESFVSYYAAAAAVMETTSVNDSLQILVLGGGLDIMGLWSMSLEEKLTVHVIEVDCNEIVELKNQVLVSSGLVQPLETPIPSKSGPHPVRLYAKHSAHGNSSLVLVPSDLVNVDHLQTQLKEWMNPQIPTLILSELVLAYLPISARDNLLRYCADLTKTRRPSCLVVYEPLGDSLRDEKGSSHEGISVLQAYQRSYFQHFVDKLERGQSSDAIDSSNISFHPLASSCAQVEILFKASGFGDARAVSAGRAAVVARRIGDVKLDACEIFDEHAALVLHLQSYVLACGCPSNLDPMFKQYLCGGVVGLARPRCIRVSHDTPVWLARVEARDESQVRRLFSQTYEHLFDPHPAIRKMVKTALKKDLRSNPLDKMSSSIGSYYTSQGGDFLVIVQNVAAGTGEESQQQQPQSRVLAGIGFRQCIAQECFARKWSSTTFEIHRLFVDPDSRQAGLASALLETVLGIVSKPCQLIATTPAILESANAFYKAKGFNLCDEELMGDLLMRSYLRQVPDQIYSPT